ncbi:hypothetical protein JCM17960_09880 [Magnetospira thiophila]
MIRRFLLALLIGAVCLGLGSEALLRQDMRQTQSQLFSDAQFLLNHMADHILLELHQARSDLRYLATQPELIDAAARESPVPLAINLNFQRFVEQKGIYDQIRLLDLSGQERARVDYRAGSSEIIPPETLQDKSHRPYFQEAVKLSAGQIYTSVFDLNQEHRRIELPLKPMIRFAQPLFDAEGRKVGVLVLNYLGRRILDELRHASTTFPGQALLTNAQGFYMLGPNREDEWGFMFADGADLTLAKQSPALWQQLAREPLLRVSDAQGLHIIGRLSHFVERRDGQEAEDCRECGWILGLRIPAAYLKNLRMQRRTQGIPVYFMLLGVYGLGVALTLHYARRKRLSETQVAALHAEIQAERDAFIGGPTVVFKWLNQFGWPVEFVSANVESVLGYSVDQFLNRDITYTSIIAPAFLAQVTEETRALTQDGQHWIERQPYQVVDGQGRLRWLRDTTTALRDHTGQITHYHGYVNDITDLKLAELHLRETGQYVQKVLDSTPDATLVIDTKTHALTFANRAALEIYGPMTDAEGLPLPCHKLSHNSDQPCEGADDPCPISTILDSKKTCRVIHRHFDSKGHPLYVELVASPIFDEHGHVTQIIETHRDVTTQVQERSELEELATRDSLTQTCNRLKFDLELTRHMQQSRSSGQALGLIMFDLDHFKEINDTRGHDAGDSVLQETADVIRARTRRSDVLARWGGEEFIILTPDTNLAIIRRIAENLRASLERHSFLRAGRVTASFGATIMKPTDDSEALLKRVDDALYEAKHGGRNMVVVKEP